MDSGRGTRDADHWGTACRTLVALGGCILAVAATLLMVTARPGEAQAPADTALANALEERGRIDQAIRDTMVRRLQAGESLDSLFGARMMAIDSANTTWLKALVAKRGWPGRSLVGKDAAEAAFLIVQHAVHDSAFQASALALMQQGVASGEVAGQNVAMLADRVAVHRGQRQLYGTQARILNGRVVLDPIDDSAHVDERRARLGMPPLAVYVRVLDSVYTTHHTPQ